MVEAETSITPVDALNTNPEGPEKVPPEVVATGDGSGSFIQK